MCPSTADTEILSYRLNEVSSEFHSGQPESLKSNEQLKISLSLRRTSGGDACKKPQFGQSARRRSQSLTRRGMSNDRFETARPGETGNPTNGLRHDAVFSKRDRDVADPQCFVFSVGSLLLTLNSALTDGSES